MFCCQTSNTISESQKCSSQCRQNRGSKKSIRPHFPSKTGSLPLILRLRDRYQLCFFQLLLHLFQLLDCCPNFSTPTEGIYRCPFPEKKKKQIICISYTYIYIYIHTYQVSFKTQEGCHLPPPKRFISFSHHQFQRFCHRVLATFFPLVLPFLHFDLCCL